MSHKSKIEWCDATWSPIVGCSKISPGCKFCYAERTAIRLNGIFAAKGDDNNWAKMSNVLEWDYSKPEFYEFGKATGWNGEVELFVNRLDQPRHWRTPRRIFVCSMSDLFHPKVPFEFIDKVFDVIRRTPQHTYQILTKRIKRMADFIYQAYGVNHELGNAWLGVSISNQAEADEKIPILLQIPAAIRFLSIEPMLESIEIPKEYLGKEIDHYFGKAREKELTAKQFISGNYPDDFIDWGICGCESGPKRRPCPDIKDIVGQFHAAQIPLFVKQINVNGKVVKMPKNFPQEYPA